MRAQERHASCNGLPACLPRVVVVVVVVSDKVRCVYTTRVWRDVACAWRDSDVRATRLDSAQFDAMTRRHDMTRDETTTRAPMTGVRCVLLGFGSVTSLLQFDCELEAT